MTITRGGCSWLMQQATPLSAMSFNEARNTTCKIHSRYWRFLLCSTRRLTTVNTEFGLILKRKDHKSDQSPNFGNNPTYEGFLAWSLSPCFHSNFYVQTDWWLTCNVLKTSCMTWLTCSEYATGGARLSDRSVRCWSMFLDQLMFSTYNSGVFLSELYMRSTCLCSRKFHMVTCLNAQEAPSSCMVSSSWNHPAGNQFCWNHRCVKPFKRQSSLAQTFSHHIWKLTQKMVCYFWTGDSRRRAEWFQWACKGQLHSRVERDRELGFSSEFRWKKIRSFLLLLCWSDTECCNFGKQKIGINRSKWKVLQIVFTLWKLLLISQNSAASSCGNATSHFK